MFTCIPSFRCTSEFLRHLLIDFTLKPKKLATKDVSNLGEAIDLLKNTFSEGVKTVQPFTLIRNKIRVVNGHLAVEDQSYLIRKRCYAVGFGKAVLGMAAELEKVLGDCLERALITVPKGIFEQYPNLRGTLRKTDCIEGAKNNIPDEEAVEGARKIKKLVEGLGKDDLLIIMISGGGSALLPLPKPPVTLQEKQNLIKCLSKGGATIQELNTVRKQLSVLKGGGLAKLAYPCQIVSLILSDVVGDPLDIIASGPTVYSNENPATALEILNKYNIYQTLPPNIKRVLKSAPALSQSHQLNGQFEHVANFVIGTNKIAAEAAKNYSMENGCQCAILSRKVEEDVDRLALIYSDLAHELVEGNVEAVTRILNNVSFELEEEGVKQLMEFDFTKKMLLIFAGEPTVVVKGRGLGGRNQQLALAFSLQLDRWVAKSGNISLLSGGTDGIDGPTDAAGAIGFSRLVEICSRLDINPNRFLTDNDSYGFFSKFMDGECLIKIGHSGTNVMDLHLLLIDPQN